MRIHKRIFFTLALPAILFLPYIPCLAQTTGTLTVLPPPDSQESGDIESVGECLSGACFSSVLSNLVYASPDSISGLPTFRSILLSDLPSTVSTDAELLSHSSTASAHHNWPLTDAEIPNDITVLSSTDDNLSDNEIGDLLDVDETGTSTGEALISNGSGSWLPSISPVCLSDGTNCPPSGGTGDVVGPASSTDNAVVTWDGTTGDLVQNSTLIWDGADLTLPIASQIQVPYGDATDPSIEAPSGSGIYWSSSASAMNITVSGVAGWTIYNCTGPQICLVGGVIDASALISRASSATSPTILPSREALSSGLGGARNAPALIVSGSSRITATTVGATIVGDLSLSGALTTAQINSPYSQICSSSGDANPGTLIITVSEFTYKSITNSDPDGCTVILSESGAVNGQRLEIIISSNVGGNVSFSDTAGVSEISSVFLAGIYDSITFRYISDRWVEVSRSNN